MKRSLSLSLGLLAQACAPEFDPYNELEGLRVLAVRAEPAQVQVGESTTLDALYYNDTDEDITRTWSLCPWPTDPNIGFECPVDQKLLDAAWRTAKLDGDALSLARGTAETASFVFPGTQEDAQALCRALAERIGSAATVLPDCDERWDWMVRLDARAGRARVDTVKSVTLLLTDDQIANRNPRLTGLSVEQKGRREALSAQKPLELAVDGDHVLRVSVADDAAEMYRPVLVEGEPDRGEEREALTFTWFVDAGSTDRTRSTYKDGVESLAKATKNEWYAPERARDARIFVVVRDQRGGVDWREGLVRLVD